MSHLADAHLTMLRASAIGDEVINQRAYATVTSGAALKRLGFSDLQARVPALLLPVFAPHGEVVLYQTRPDQPRIIKGKAIKYETPRGATMAIDVHPSIRHLLGDPHVPLFVTEGIKKGDSLVSHGCCAVALLGVWNWRGTNEFGGKTALADWEYIDLKERRVCIVFDSDVMTNPMVHSALVRLSEFLKGRGADVDFVYLPGGTHGEKVGVDDYLAAGHTIDELLQLATPHLRDGADPDEADDPIYRASDYGLLWTKPTQHGPVETTLTNFTASISADVVEDDGAETRRSFEVEGRLGARSRRFRVPATQFNSMNWATEHLGAGAIVFPGFGLRDHARAAVQVLSGDVPERHVFAHTGWRKIRECWAYLHGDGAVGSEGRIDDVSVELSGSLGLYRLPAPPVGQLLASSVQASLRLFDVAPMSVTSPLIGATFLAPLREALIGCMYDLVIWFHGATGNFKTEIVVLSQAHYGPFVRTNLPLTFTATANAVERMLFAGKDAVVVVDDYHPAADRREEQAMASVASRLLRGVGNGSGRPRMRADTSLRPDLPPRALPIATGERLPAGHSTTARLFPVAIDPGAVDKNLLSAAQQDAHLLPHSMSAYLSWLAVRLDDLRVTLPVRFKELRARASVEDMHAREPAQIAHLQIGVETFLRFAVDSGVLQPEEAASIDSRTWVALARSSADHRSDLIGEAPAQRFVALLLDVLASKRAYLEGPRGSAPPDAESWGWERRAWIDQNGDEQSEWRHAPSVPLLGRLDEDFLYLYPEATYQCVSAAANQAGQTFPVDLKTLLKRLDDSAFIVCETEGDRRRRTVNHRFGNQTRRVIQLRCSALSPRQHGEHGEQREQQQRFESVPVVACSPEHTRDEATGNSAGHVPASEPRSVPHVPPHEDDKRDEEHEVYVV